MSFKYGLMGFLQVHLFYFPMAILHPLAGFPYGGTWIQALYHYCATSEIIPLCLISKVDHVLLIQPFVYRMWKPRFLNQSLG